MSSIIATDPEVIRQRRLNFVEALESGEFPQGNGYLCIPSRDRTGAIVYDYCCLGVACEVAIRDGLSLAHDKQEATEGNGVTYFLPMPEGEENPFSEEYIDGSNATLPMAVRDWYGFEEENPSLNIVDIEPTDPHTDAAEANDEKGYSFRLIAHLFRTTYGLPVQHKAVLAKDESGDWVVNLIPLETWEAMNSLLADPSSGVHRERPRRKEEE